MIKKTTFKTLLISTYLVAGLFLTAKVGFSANSQASKISQVDLLKIIAKASPETIILDVRSPREYSKGHVPLAINIPHYKILETPSLLSTYKEKTIILYCHSGIRAGKVIAKLSKLNKPYGKTILHLTGDYRAWVARGLPTSSK